MVAQVAEEAQVSTAEALRLFKQHEYRACLYHARVASEHTMRLLITDALGPEAAIDGHKKAKGLLRTYFEETGKADYYNCALCLELLRGMISTADAHADGKPGKKAVPVSEFRTLQSLKLLSASLDEALRLAGQTPALLLADQQESAAWYGTAPTGELVLFGKPESAQDAVLLVLLAANETGVTLSSAAVHRVIPKASRIQVGSVRVALSRLKAMNLVYTDSAGQYCLSQQGLRMARARHVMVCN